MSAPEQPRTRLAQAAEEVIDHVERAFRGGTTVDPVFLELRAAIDSELPPDWHRSEGAISACMTAIEDGVKRLVVYASSSTREQDVTDARTFLDNLPARFDGELMRRKEGRIS